MLMKLSYCCGSYWVWSKSGCKVVIWCCALYLMAFYSLGHLSIVFISCCFGVVTSLVFRQLQQSFNMSAGGQQQSLMPVMSLMTNTIMKHMAIIPSVLGLYVPGWNMGSVFLFIKISFMVLTNSGGSVKLFGRIWCLWRWKVSGSEMILACVKRLYPCGWSKKLFSCCAKNDVACC